MFIPYETDEEFMGYCLDTITEGRGLSCATSQCLYDMCGKLRDENAILHAERDKDFARRSQAGIAGQWVTAAFLSMLIFGTAAASVVVSWAQFKAWGWFKGE